MSSILFGDTMVPNIGIGCRPLSLLGEALYAGEKHQSYIRAMCSFHGWTDPGKLFRQIVGTRGKDPTKLPTNNPNNPNPLSLFLAPCTGAGNL